MIGAATVGNRPCRPSASRAITFPKSIATGATSRTGPAWTSCATASFYSLVTLSTGGESFVTAQRRTKGAHSSLPAF